MNELTNLYIINLSRTLSTYDCGVTMLRHEAIAKGVVLSKQQGGLLHLAALALKVHNTRLNANLLKLGAYKGG